jgi:hypothetical protein
VAEKGFPLRSSVFLCGEKDFPFLVFPLTSGFQFPFFLAVKTAGQNSTKRLRGLSAEC